MAWGEALIAKIFTMFPDFSTNKIKDSMTTTKVEFLLSLLHEVKETLISIQKERFDVNVDEKPLKTKKKVTDENFQKLIKLKNEDFNTILAIQNEILALDAEDENLHTYMTKDLEAQINTLNKCFDQTFAVVDQMKRETEFIENTSAEDESFSMTPIKSDDFDRNKNESSSSCGDSNSNSNYEALTEGTISSL